MAALKPPAIKRGRDAQRRSTFDPWIRSGHTSPTSQDSVISDDQNRVDLAVRAVSADSPRSPTAADFFDAPSDPTPPIPPRHPRHQPIEAHTRFSLLRFRNASEPQLSARAREQAGHRSPSPPPLPLRPDMRSIDTPAIIMTAPASDAIEQSPKPSLKRQKSRFAAFSRQKSKDAVTPLELSPSRLSSDHARDKAEKRKSRFGSSLRPSRTSGLDDLRSLASNRASPDLSSADNQRAVSALSLFGRRSEDSRVPDSMADDHVASAPNGSPERPSQASNTHPHSQFSWLHRKKQNRSSLFPLPVKLSPANGANGDRPSTPRTSTGGRRSYSPDHSPIHPSPLHFANSRLSIGDDEPQSLGVEALAASTTALAAPGSTLLRTCSAQSDHSTHSTPNLTNSRPKRRNRSSTVESSDDAPPTPPFASTGSGRNSTSTAGRSSFSNLFTLNRLRHSTDPNSPRQGSPGNSLTLGNGLASHTNSLNISREILHLPEREEGETAIQFLSRAEDIIPKSQLPTLLSKTDDEFMHTVMRSFMRKFSLFGDPLDMAIRKLLMEVDLPKETQQIDRVLQSFADRYHECNPGIFATADNAYFIAFSILILQTDAFNKNNKRKMTKQDYVKNSSIEGVSSDVLECFYDNIIYTPFIRVEDDEDIKTVRSRRRKKAVKTIQKAVPDPAKKTTTKEPLDPYLLILDQKLDTLRPPIREVMNLDDPYSYLGSAAALDRTMLRTSKTGILQIESARSRPNAFMSPSGIENPQEARAGIVELPVDKVGLLWRKDPKKKTARSPWQEWGAILCGAGLYFFKNTTWVKSLIHQYETHARGGQPKTPCTFRPAIENFKPDYMLPTDHAVALQDGNYKRHKNAFIFFRHNGSEEVFLADNEAEMNDWLVKLNQQAAFKTAGIRQRGLIDSHYDAQRQQTLRRFESNQSESASPGPQTLSPDAAAGPRAKVENQLTLQITAARQVTMRNQILDAEEKLAAVISQIDGQLRDARHLLCLAPIQQKSREQLVHAAGRMAAKLKWVRIEMWRMKCHRDILALDLEDEKKDFERKTGRAEGLTPKLKTYASNSSASTSKATRVNGIERLPSAASSALAPSRTVSQSIVPNRPGTKSSLTSQATENDDDVFTTPPEANSPSATPAGARRSSVERLALALKSNRNSMLSPRSPRLEPADEEAGPLSPAFSEYKTPTLDDAEAERQREGLFPPETPDADGSSDVDVTPMATTGSVESATRLTTIMSDSGDTSLPQTASPEGRKVRRSLQRSLRDPSTPGSHGGHHHRPSISGSSSNFRSKLNNRSDSTASSALPLETSASGVTTKSGDPSLVGSVQEAENQLKREKGSFTVHGKKASVVTFGAEWASLPAEERLKIRKQAQTPLITPAEPLAFRSPVSFYQERDYLNLFEEVDDEPDAEPESDLATPAQRTRSDSNSPMTRVTPPPKERQSSVSSRGSVTPVPTPRATVRDTSASESPRRTSAVQSSNTVGFAANKAVTSEGAGVTTAVSQREESSHDVTKVKTPNGVSEAAEVLSQRRSPEAEQVGKENRVDGEADKAEPRPQRQQIPIVEASA